MKKELSQEEKEKYVEDAKSVLNGLKSLLISLEEDLYQEELDKKSQAVWIVGHLGMAGKEAINSLP